MGFAELASPTASAVPSNTPYSEAAIELVLKQTEVFAEQRATTDDA